MLVTVLLETGASKGPPDPFYAVSVTSVYTESHFHTNAAILFCTATGSNWILLIITLIFNIGVFCLVIYLEF